MASRPTYRRPQCHRHCDHSSVQADWVRTQPTSLDTSRTKPRDVTARVTWRALDVRQSANAPESNSTLCMRRSAEAMEKRSRARGARGKLSDLANLVRIRGYRVPRIGVFFGPFAGSLRFPTQTQLLIESTSQSARSELNSGISRDGFSCNDR